MILKQRRESRRGSLNEEGVPISVNLDSNSGRSFVHMREVVCRNRALPNNTPVGPTLKLPKRWNFGVVQTVRQDGGLGRRVIDSTRLMKRLFGPSQKSGIRVW